MAFMEKYKYVIINQFWLKNKTEKKNVRGENSQILIKPE